MDYKFQIYTDAGDDWRWRLRHKNGNILAVSSESYKNKQDMIDIILNIVDSIRGFGLHQENLLEEDMTH